MPGQKYNAMKLAAFPKCFMDQLTVERTMTVFDWVELARAELKPVGVLGLEMYYGALASYGAGYLAEVRAAHEQAGFLVPMLCASPDFTHPEPEQRAAEVARQRQMLDVAAALGCQTCRVLSGQRRPEVSREDGIRWVVTCIRELLPHAQERGVILTIENHFKDNYWQYPEFAQSMERFVEIVDQIQSPWFGVNFDPSNVLLAREEPMALLQRVKHRVVTMHASDRRPRPGVDTSQGIADYSQLVHGEVGTGLIDYDAIFSVLRSAGFGGWVSIEDGVNGIEELKRSARFVASKMSELPAASGAA